MKIVFAMLAVAGFCCAQVPSGWKVAKDKATGACQLATPPDWVADKLLSSFVSSPDKKATVVIHSVKGQTFAEAVANSKMVMKPAKVIEDSSRRYWYAYNLPSGKPGTNWYIAVSATPPCTADVSFTDSSMEDLAKKIVATIGPAN